MKKILSTADLILLSLMIFSLPSLEAPKNIFLASYLVVRIIIEIIQFKEGLRSWKAWDTIFLTIIFTGLLSTIFAGFSGLEEWRGYKVLLTAILTGWFLSRAQYSKDQYQFVFKLIILSTLPPLIWGLYQQFIIHSKEALELHSVGHVNHSSIYLIMIFGASLAWCLSEFNAKKEKVNLSLQLILLLFLSLLFFSSLIISQSRGAFGVAVILSVMLFFLLAKNKIIKMIGYISIAITLILTVAFEAPIVQKHIHNQENHNILSFRDRVWNVSLEASRFYPLLGIGMSNWHFINLDQLKKSVEGRGKTFDAKHYFFPGHSHNLYLTALVERGVVGLLVTFLFFVAWLRNLIGTFDWSKKSKLSICLWGGSFSAWSATFITGFVNTTFHHEHAILACLFLGLYLSHTNSFSKIKLKRVNTLDWP